MEANPAGRSKRARHVEMVLLGANSRFGNRECARTGASHQRRAGHQARERVERSRLQRGGRATTAVAIAGRPRRLCSELRMPRHEHEGWEIFP